MNKFVRIAKKIYYCIRGKKYLSRKIDNYMALVNDQNRKLTLKDVNDMFDVFEACIAVLRLEGYEEEANDLCDDVKKILNT